MGLWEGVTLFSFEPREAFAQKNWKILDSLKHRSSNCSLPSEFGDLRYSLCIIPCHFSYENEQGSGWILLSLPELREWAVMVKDRDFLVISVCGDPGQWVQGCRNRAFSCSLGAGLGEFPAAGSPGRQALAQLRVSTLIYVSTHTAELSLAPAELHPPKHMQALALGNIGKVKTPHQHTYTFKAGCKARFGINQTFSLLLLCILTPDNLTSQAVSLLGVYKRAVAAICWYIIQQLAWWGRWPEEVA